MRERWGWVGRFQDPPLPSTPPIPSQVHPRPVVKKSYFLSNLRPSCCRTISLLL